MCKLLVASLIAVSLHQSAYAAEARIGAFVLGMSRDDVLNTSSFMVCRKENEEGVIHCSSPENRRDEYNLLLTNHLSEEQLMSIEHTFCTSDSVEEIRNKLISEYDLKPSQLKVAGSLTEWRLTPDVELADMLGTPCYSAGPGLNRHTISLVDENLFGTDDDAKHGRTNR